MPSTKATWLEPNATRQSKYSWRRKRPVSCYCPSDAEVGLKIVFGAFFNLANLIVRCRSECYSHQQCYFAWSRVVASLQSCAQSGSDEEGPYSACYSWYIWWPDFEDAGKKGITLISALENIFLFVISSKLSPTAVWAKVPERRLAVSIFCLVFISSMKLISNPLRIVGKGAW